jgi:hypothetical protein
MDDDDSLMFGTMCPQIKLDVGFHTPAKCVDARHCSISPNMLVCSSKKKRLFGSHVSEGVGISISSSSPDVEVVDDPGSWKDFFDLRVSSYLHRYKPDIKHVISLVAVSDPVYVESVANCGTSVESLVVCGASVESPVVCGIYVESLVVCDTPIKSPATYRISLVVSPSHEHESSLLDSKPVCVASGCFDFVVARGQCQLHIDELFNISALVLLS